jgi:hypothetical protein
MRESTRDQLMVAALLVVVIVSLSAGYPAPLRTTAVVTFAAALTLAIWNSRDDVALGITGMIVGPVIEMAATSSALWHYSSPSVGGVPIWVVPMWWIYPVTVARLIRSINGCPIAVRSSTFAIAVILIEVPWLCVFGVHRPLVAFSGVIMLLCVWVWHRHSLNDVIALVICGLLGPGAELIPVRMGAWAYPDGPLFGLPLWLPAGYGVFGAALIQLGLSLAARYDDRQLIAQPLDTLRQLHDPESKQRVAGWQP